MSANANWNFPTSIRFGAGRIAELPQVCQELGIARPLLVTDAGLARLPMVEAVRARLADAGLGVALFGEVRPNPLAGNLDAGLAAYRAGAHDGVVALGGGSALDMGKLIAFMAGQQVPVWAFEDIGDAWTRADADAIAPIIAVPTTAGTGSEVGRCGVLLDPASGSKKIIFHPRMLPQRVICDPELTTGMPRTITAGTGMDALAHCLEAYCAPGFHPMADGIAVEGVRLIAHALPKVMRDPHDIDARGDMMAAAAMGATAFQKGLGGMHALSHPIGALHDTHHGMTNAVLMPYVLAFNRAAIEDRIDRLAAWMRLQQPDFDGFMHWLLALRTEIGIPPTLAALGIDDGNAERVAAMAVEDPSAAGNPRPLDIEATRALFAAAWSGDLGRYR
jgi:alcohol dehydrogenase class IV